MEKKNQRRLKCRKYRRLRTEELRKLIGEIKNKTLIWDSTNKNHSNRNLVDQAWNDIAVAMGILVNECKKNWQSVLDGRRYRMKIKNQSSTRLGGVPMKNPSLDDSIVDWEFAEDLEFLPIVRRNFVNRTLNNCNTRIESSEENSSLNLKLGNNSNYAYEDINIAEFINNLNEMVEQQKQSYYNIKYEIIARNLDRMLQQLPESQIEDVNFELISVIYEKIRENEENNISK